MSPTLQALKKKQSQHFPQIAEELETHQRKIGHWAWWVFPTNRPGRSEPYPKTCVQPNERALLLQGESAEDWKKILCIIADLMQKTQSWHDVLPSIDHGRLRFFIRYWKPESAHTPWLKSVLQIFKEYQD